MVSCDRWHQSISYCDSEDHTPTSKSFLPDDTSIFQTYPDKNIEFNRIFQYYVYHFSLNQ